MKIPTFLSLLALSVCVHAELTDELLLMARWLDRNAGRIRVNHVEGELSSPVRPVPVPGRVAVPAARRLAS